MLNFEVSLISIILAVVSVSFMLVATKGHKMTAIICVILSGIFLCLFIAYGIYSGIDLLSLVTTVILIGIVDYLLFNNQKRKLIDKNNYDKEETINIEKDTNHGEDNNAI